MEFGLCVSELNKSHLELITLLDDYFLGYFFLIVCA